MSLDVRETLILEGLADSRLQGLVPAERYAVVSPAQVVTPFTAIRRAPDNGAEQVDQILFGERFEILETRAGFAFGRAPRDGYVGWVDQAALTVEIAAPSHWVSAPVTLAFAEPSIKTSARGPIPLNGLVAIVDETETLAHDLRLGWIPKTHLTPIGAVLEDPAAVALSFVGQPYLWGGRGGDGIDCSGLVQQALAACGAASPRDSDQQESLGLPTSPDELRRGDLVFWAGHVAMMIDARRMVHANAFHMAVAVEPLGGARRRILSRGGGEPIAFRRLAT